MLIECACCKKETEHQHLHNCAHGIPDPEKTHYETTYDRMQRLESQLAEARAENERLTLENRQMLQGMKWDNQLKAIARQEAAREILQLLDTADWACSTYEETYYQAVAAIKSKFELEG